MLLNRRSTDGSNGHQVQAGRMATIRILLRAQSKSSVVAQVKRSVLNCCSYTVHKKETYRLFTTGVSQLKIWHF
jgi:hypothetical protein